MKVRRDKMMSGAEYRFYRSIALSRAIIVCRISLFIRNDTALMSPEIFLANDCDNASKKLEIRLHGFNAIYTNYAPLYKFIAAHHHS